MKFVRLLILPVFIGLLLSACGNAGSTGARANSNNPALYGNLQGLPESGPVMTADELSSFFLSDRGLCYGLESSSSIDQLLCGINVSYIMENPNVFESSIGNPLAASVKSYKITYNTQGAPYALQNNGTSNEIVSGSVLVPDMAPDQIKGVVLYYHETIFSKFEVPSNFANANGFALDQMLAAVYALQGFIVVAPDYVGQGNDQQVMHPFVLYPQTNAQSGYYMLKAVHQFLTNHGLLGATQPLPLFITSYSEGAAYALWASHLLQTEADLSGYLQSLNLTLKRTVGISGAYDLTNVMLPFSFDNVYNSLESSVNTYNVSPGCDPNAGGYASLVCLAQSTQSALAAVYSAASKMALASLLLTSFDIYTLPPNVLGWYMNPAFYNMGKCLSSTYFDGGSNSVSTCLINNTNYDLIQLYTDTSGALSSSAINAQVNASASGAGDFITGGYNLPTLLGLMTKSNYRNNSISAVISPLLLNQPTVMQFAAQSNIYNWQTNSPVSILYLKYDSTVPNINSLEACNIANSVANSSNNLMSNSAPGLVTCQEIDNSQLWTDLANALSLESAAPILMDHSMANTTAQVAALHQILTTP